jgi:hypothetical protein
LAGHASGNTWKRISELTQHGCISTRHNASTRLSFSSMTSLTPYAWGAREVG